MGNRGFSIIELLVATSILVVLSATSLAVYSSVQKGQRDQQRKDDLNKIMQALELYRTDMHYYPKSAGFVLGTGAPLVSSSSTYLNPVPDDPKAGELGQHYCYRGLKTDGMSECGNNDSGDFCGQYVVCAKMEASGNQQAPLACQPCICKDSPETCNLGFSSK